MSIDWTLKENRMLFRPEVLNDWQNEIYQEILEGKKHNQFENYLRGIDPRFKRTKKSFNKIKSKLRKDFENGNLPTNARYPVKKWLMWLWETNKVKMPASPCKPHMRILDNYIYYYDAKIKNIETQKTTSIFYLNKDGYALYNNKLVHRLMAEAWFENWDPCLEVNHIDRNRTNNNIQNLELVDHYNNLLHRDGKSYESKLRMYTEGV